MHGGDLDGVDVERVLAFEVLVSAVGPVLDEDRKPLVLPLAAILVLTVACGAGTAISGALYTTVSQRTLPAEALARVSSYNVLGAFALGPLGLAIAGPVGGAVGYATLLGFGACYQVVSVGLMLAIPAGRRLPEPKESAETPILAVPSS